MEEARAHKAQLIALGTHGRGGLGRMLLGSVADKVVRGAWFLCLYSGQRKELSGLDMVAKPIS